MQSAIATHPPPHLHQTDGHRQQTILLESFSGLWERDCTMICVQCESTRFRWLFMMWMCMWVWCEKESERGEALILEIFTNLCGISILEKFTLPSKFVENTKELMRNFPSHLLSLSRSLSFVFSFNFVTVYPLCIRVLDIINSCILALQNSTPASAIKMN